MCTPTCNNCTVVVGDHDSHPDVVHAPTIHAAITTSADFCTLATIGIPQNSRLLLNRVDDATRKCRASYIKDFTVLTRFRFIVLSQDEGDVDMFLVKYLNQYFSRVSL